LRHPAVLLFVLLFIVGATWLLHDSGPAEKAGDPEVTHLTGPRIDYYLRGLHTTTMGPDGKPARTLRAAQVKHFQDDDTTELASPQLVIHQGDEPAWNLQAESGWVSADGALILLKNKVQVDREKGIQNQPLHIDTTNLRVQPLEDYAETDEQVRVRSHQDRLDATGMQIWLRQPSRIKFLADVKGFYAPPK